MRCVETISTPNFSKYWVYDGGRLVAILWVRKQLIRRLEGYRLAIKATVSEQREILAKALQACGESLLASRLETDK